jgi:hypothetical protein
MSFSNRKVQLVINSALSLAVVAFLIYFGALMGQPAKTVVVLIIVTPILALRVWYECYRVGKWK